MDHDLFQYMHLQYVFFNEAVQHGRLPRWLPFVTHGAPSNFWIVISQGLAASAVSAAGRRLALVPFLPYFEAGLFFDEFAFVLGCLLLARRCYRSPVAVLFVTASLAYTTITARQPWYNFHLVYLLPLLLYCLDRAARDASPRHLGLAALVGAGTVLGNLPYFLPLTVFTVAVFAAAVAAFARDDLPRTVRQLGRSIAWPAAAALAVPVCLAAAVAVFVRDGFAHTIFAAGRTTHGQVALRNFLTYGWATGFGKFNDLIGRYPSGLNNRDNTLYAGVLTVPFCLVALARVRAPMSYAFGATAVVLALFSAGTFVSEAFYFAMPFGRYYRDVGHAAPLAKLFVVFYAGYGVDAFWDVARRVALYGSLRPRRDRIVVYLLIAALTAGPTLLLAQRGFASPSYWFPDVPGFAYVVALTVAFLVLFVVMLRRPDLAAALAAVALVIHVADVLWFKTEFEYLRVPPVSAAVIDLFRPAAYGFPTERTLSYTNARFAALAPAILEHGVLPGGGRTPYFYEYRFHGGSLYWTTDSFLFLDAAASPFRTDFWQDGVDAFYHAWVPPAAAVHEHLGFPMPEAPAYRKLSGVEFPKLQLFAGIRLLPADAAVARALAAPGFAGNQVVASAQDTTPPGTTGGTQIFRRAAGPPRTGDRLERGSVVVQTFTFDTLRVRVTNGAPTAGVLYYADAWDPGWRAFVDGAPVPVLRANLGFKAVVVPPGSSEVRFAFGTARGRILGDALPLLGVLVIGAITFIAISELRAQPRDAVRRRGAAVPFDTPRAPPI